VRVLVVDDNRPLLASGARALRAEGFEVVESDGASALLHLEPMLWTGELRFDLIVSEVRLGLVSGIELCEGLLGLDIAIPVIWTVRACTEAIRRAGQALGVCAVLESPYDTDRLCVAARQCTRVELAAAPAG
jgi:CheY-like chemotaxis protein